MEKFNNFCKTVFNFFKLLKIVIIFIFIGSCVYFCYTIPKEDILNKKEGKLNNKESAINIDNMTYEQKLKHFTKNKINIADLPYDQKEKYLNERKIALENRQDKDSHKYFCDDRYIQPSEWGQLCYDCFSKKIDISENSKCLLLMIERAGFKKFMSAKDFQETHWYIDFIASEKEDF